MLTPNEVKSYDELPNRIIEFEGLFNLNRQPFKWNFTRNDLKELIRKLSWTDSSIPKDSLQKEAG